MEPRIGDSDAHVERALHGAIARLASPATHKLCEVVRAARESFRSDRSFPATRRGGA